MKFIYICLLALAVTGQAQASPVTVSTQDGTGTYELKFSTYTDANVSPDGAITISGAEYLSGTLPVFAGGTTCGEGTVYQAMGNQCVVEDQTNPSSSSSSSAPDTACTPAPSYVRFSNTPALSSLGAAGSLIEFTLPQHPIVLSRAVTLPAGASGKINLAGASWTSAIPRAVWFSECPGGEAVTRCTQTGLINTLSWATRQVRASCVLQPNTEYFLNMSSPGCSNSSGCAAIVHYLGGW